MRNRKRQRRLPLMASTFLAGALLGAGAGAAQAYVQSGFNYPSGAGISYNNIAFGEYTSSNDAGVTLNRTTSGQSAGGWMGSKVTIYRADGTQCRGYTDFAYNGGATRQYIRLLDTLQLPCRGQNIFTKGSTQVWNGNGYNTTGTERTPNWVA